MTLRIRSLLVGTVVLAVVALSASTAWGALEIERFFAANCFEPTCTAASPTSTIYRQASGHPPYGITDFKIAETMGGAPSGVVTHVRTDVAPGVSTNPEAVAKCSLEEFGSKEAIPGTGFYAESKCPPGSKVGTNEVVVATPVGHLPLTGTVYNLVQPEGLSSDFGVALPLPIPLTAAVISGTPLKGTPAETAQYYAHTLIEGHVEWGQQPSGTGKGDYHDYFEINVSPEIPLISSRLIFEGKAGTTSKGAFLTLPSSCVGSGPATTTTLHLESLEGVPAKSTYTVPVGTEGCNGLPPFALVPFDPGFSFTPEKTKSDEPDGITTELTIPHDPDPAHIDSSQLKTASITLPEGMTLNPSAAQGLEACTPAQARIHSPEFGTSCPPKSEIGTAALNVPGLPDGSLTGALYLGGPESGPITGPPYTMYIDAGSKRYGVSVRLMGEVKPDASTGRVTAVFDENPEQPFSDLILRFKPGALAPIANPLVCGPAKAETSLVPYTGTETKSPFSTFTVDGNNAGGACPSPLPFALTQGTVSTPTTGGANTSFTLNLARGDGQQYLSRVSATLPPGLVGKIPAVPLCPEPQATLGTCSASSQIGTATTTVGSGPTPVQFSGPVYLTGPTGNAPYGTTTVVSAAVGPFSLGNVIVRTGIEVDPFTARVTVAGEVPTIFKGIPLRLKTLSVAIDRQGFLVNPTNCGTLATNTTLTSAFGATQASSTPFQATSCSALGFKPKFGASSNAKTSRANGAALNVKVGYPSGAQANIKSVLVTVPKQLPSRLSTLKNACLENVFAANPFACPSNSRVGGATVRTPALPEKLTGPVFFVSHGGAAFPDLDVVLKGNGVTIILVGNTNIKKGITTTHFAALPDAPVSSFEMKLPIGKNSAVAAVGSLCKKSLIMPTTITAQNGKVIKQNTVVSVSHCPVTVLSRQVSGSTALITVRVPAAGRLSGGGRGLRTVYRHPGKAEKVTLKVPLSGFGRGSRPFTARVRIGFVPKKGASSVAFTNVRF